MVSSKYVEEEFDSVAARRFAERLTKRCGLASEQAPGSLHHYRLTPEATYHLCQLQTSRSSA